MTLGSGHFVDGDYEMRYKLDTGQQQHEPRIKEEEVEEVFLSGGIKIVSREFGHGGGGEEAADPKGMERGGR